MSDPAINPDTGVVAQGRSPRFMTWVAFLVFSTITLWSSVQVKNDQVETSSAARYAVFCSAATFALTAIVVVVHIFPVASTLIVGTKIEGVICILLAAFWAAIVSIVTNASNELSTEKGDTNQVKNGNLYYFSWAGFVTSVILLVSYLRAAFGVDVIGEVRNRGARLTLWAGMLAAAMIVMGSAARTQSNECSPNVKHDAAFCKRTTLAVALGAVGVIFSLIVVGMKMLLSATPFMLEFLLSFLLAAMNAFGVAYVTSTKGPGSPIGNLYYFSWISFLCGAFLAADCFNQYSGGGEAASNQGGNKEENGEVDVELQNH